MIWKDGYPKPNGASDFEDSSHLAGMMAVTEHKDAPDLRQYLAYTTRGFIYERNPWTKIDFSRDQYIMLACGYIKQHNPEYVNRAYITGKDFIPPSVRGIEELKPTLLQRLWFKAEILFHAYCNPMGEPCQIIALALTYGKEYVDLWKRHNEKWRESIREYWSGWRGEPEFAEHIINYLESK